MNGQAAPSHIHASRAASLTVEGGSWTSLPVREAWTRELTENMLYALAPRQAHPLISSTRARSPARLLVNKPYREAHRNRLLLRLRSSLAQELLLQAAHAPLGRGHAIPGAFRSPVRHFRLE